MAEVVEKHSPPHVQISLRAHSILSHISAETSKKFGVIVEEALEHFVQCRTGDAPVKAPKTILDLFDVLNKMDGSKVAKGGGNNAKA